MRYVFWLLLAAALIWGWQNPDPVRSGWETSSKWLGEKARMLADKWAPLPEVQASSGEEEIFLPELAPDVFALRQEVLVSSKGAIVKWPAGSSVRKLGEGGGKILVSDGTNQTTVDVELLTRDMQERKAIHQKARAASAGQARAAAESLERELAEVESKIYSLQNEKRQLLMKQMEYGQTPMTTTVEFLDLSLKAQERRRQEIHKLLGRSTPQMLIAR